MSKELDVDALEVKARRALTKFATIEQVEEAAASVTALVAEVRRLRSELADWEEAAAGIEDHEQHTALVARVRELRKERG